MKTTIDHLTPLTNKKGKLTGSLLMCGIISSFLYIGMNILIPLLYEGYSTFTQTVSELSAIDAPTRQIWLAGIVIYTILLVAFGLGVILSAGRSHAIKIVGILMIIHGIFGLFWPPMHQREVLAAGGGTLTDTLHIAWTMITVPMFLLEVGFGATAFGKGFRVYSMMSIVIIIGFGILTGMDSSRMEADLPTPWMGVWERISIAGFMIWVIVFAWKLQRKEKQESRPGRETRQHG